MHGAEFRFQSAGRSLLKLELERKNEKKKTSSQQFVKISNEADPKTSQEISNKRSRSFGAKKSNAAPAIGKESSFKEDLAKVAKVKEIPVDVIIIKATTRH